MEQVIVTTSWDDGHKLDIRLADLLKKYKIQGTFYVSPNNREQKPADLLTPEQIRAISQSFEIGAHTVTHGVLTRLSDDEARMEIDGSKKLLETLTGKAVNAFCYPRGSFNAKHVAMVREAGFIYARTVRRHSSGFQKSFFEAETSVHMYNHWQDLWKITRFAKFNPRKIIKYFQWNELAKAMFDRIQENGGIFHLWGHSWEIEKFQDWERLEDVLKYISGKKEVEYLANSELVSKKQDKILVVSPYFPPHLGGTEFYSYNVSRGLKEKFGWNVTVATTGKRGFRVIKTRQDGLKVYRLPYWLKISNTPVNPFWPFIFKKILKEDHITLIHAHSPVPVFADMAITSGRPVLKVLTYHGLGMKKHRLCLDWLIGIYERFILPRILKMTDSIVCTSDSVSSNFAIYPLHNMVKITPGVDTNFFIPSVSGNQNRILFVGSINEHDGHKGLKYLLEAMPKVINEQPKAGLTVVGSGNNIGTFKELASSLGISDSIEFVGGKYGNDLREAYQQSGIFVIPSLNDNHPMVVLEAMASGLPVIGTTVGSIPSMVEDGKNGYLVPPGDSDRLSQAIIGLLSDPEKASAFGAKGRERAKEHYNWEARIVDYDRLFRKIILEKKQADNYERIK